MGGGRSTRLPSQPGLPQPTQSDLTVLTVLTFPTFPALWTLAVPRHGCYLEHMSTYSDVQNLKSSLFDAELVTALADTFKVLGDATRVRILDALSRDELCVGDIADILGLSESAVSHQLRLLRGARLVRQRRAGQMVFYALDDHHVVRLFEQGSEHVRERAGGVVAREYRPAEPQLAPRQHATVVPALDAGADTRPVVDSHATAADLGQER